MYSKEAQIRALKLRIEYFEKLNVAAELHALRKRLAILTAPPNG